MSLLELSHEELAQTRQFATGSYKTVYQTQSNSTHGTVASSPDALQRGGESPLLGSGHSVGRLWGHCRPPAHGNTPWEG